MRNARSYAVFTAVDTRLLFSCCRRVPAVSHSSTARINSLFAF